MQHNEIVINKQYPGLNPVQFGYQNCKPGHAYGPTVRTHWLLHYVVSGTGIFCREGKTWQLSAGDIFVIPPYVETYYEADSEDPWCYIWIGFQTDMQLPDALTQSVIRCPGVGRIFEDMRSCHGKDGGKSAFLSSRLWELFSCVLESGKTAADYLEKALSLMHSEYASQMSVSQIAQRLGLDRSYFTTMFRRKIGVAPGQYLTELRLEKAAQLMTQHGEPPTIAAASVGYSDLCNFSRAFKRKYGVPPRQYRKDYLGR